jgi:hypothetical protein
MFLMIYGRRLTSWMKGIYVLTHDTGAFEMAFQLSTALDPSVADLADLVRVELLPFLVIHLFIERLD